MDRKYIIVDNAVQKSFTVFKPTLVVLKTVLSFINIKYFKVDIRQNLILTNETQKDHANQIHLTNVRHLF